MNPAGSILFRLHLTFWDPNKFIKWRARRRSRARHSTVNERNLVKKNPHVSHHGQRSYGDIPIYTPHILQFCFHSDLPKYLRYVWVEPYRESVVHLKHHIIWRNDDLRNYWFYQDFSKKKITQVSFLKIYRKCPSK